MLVYGPPGTGKTEFCKTLAARLEAPLYRGRRIGCRQATNLTRRERLQELRLAQRLLAGDRRSILLFDEMEDLLSKEAEVLGGIVRVAPRSRALGRRFESVHEQAPGGDSGANPVDVERRPADQSRSLAPHDVRSGAAPASGQGAGAGLGATARAPWYRVDRGGPPRPRSGVRCNTGRRLRGHLSREARWRNHHGRAPWPARTRTIVVGQHAASSRTPDKYEPALIRADVDPVQLADRVTSSGARHFSLCLQGPTGTGKSVFVRYLADRIGLEVMQKRASDLLSKWVGESERNIAKAFARLATPNHSWSSTKLIHCWQTGDLP